MNENLLTYDYITKKIKPRPLTMHKGDAGKVLIVAGSKGMAGAAVLSAKGALYSGAGIVKLAVPEEIFTIMQISAIEAMCINRSELKDEEFGEFDSIIAGPGIGVKKENYDLIRRILKCFHGTVVLDADGLNCMVKYGIEPLVQRKDPTILTPHPGEADRMMKCLRIGYYNEENREGTAKSIFQATGAVTLLKGHKTIIVSKEGTFYNTSGNPGMATGGSGDVLSGIIGALCGSRYLDLSATEAALCGAYIHGMAGDHSARSFGQIGMTSKDIAESLRFVFRQIETENID